MRLLFCNVGWMERYNGKDGDNIVRGGSYNKHSTGHEVCNFHLCADQYFGYVQSRGQINLARLGAGRKDLSVGGITVVWTAGPPGGGTVVVGWYLDAVVYRHDQPLAKPTPTQKKDGVNTFRIQVGKDKAVLLPIGQRQLLIPRAVKGGIGQSNIWYADSQESAGTVSQVTALIKGFAPPPLPDVDQGEFGLEGNARLVAHLRKERDSSIVATKKAAVLKTTGRLCCEVCGFDFKKIYGDLGNEFCEVHHINPLSKSDGVVRTTLSDLAVVCSNCHRIIHRSNPMLSISGLKRLCVLSV